MQQTIDMMVLPVRAIVFDFDGTLAKPALNFEEMNKAAQHAVAALFPAALPQDRPALEWLVKIKEQLEFTKQVELGQKLDLAARQAMAKVENRAVKAGGLFPETKKVLLHVKKLGIKTAIITRNCREAVLELLPKQENLYNCLLTRDDVQEVKPHPSHLLNALILLNQAPKHALMVGDHPMDVETGKRAGVRTAAVTCGHTSIEKLVACQPDLLAADCSALLKMLKERKLLSD